MQRKSLVYFCGVAENLNRKRSIVEEYTIVDSDQCPDGFFTLKVDVTVFIKNGTAECLNKGYDMDIPLVIEDKGPY